MRGFDQPSYWSNTFDVFDWNDAHEDDDTYRIVASFERETDARTFMDAEKATKGRDLRMRPPSAYVTCALEYLATVFQAS